jgi:hypothetical protein
MRLHDLDEEQFAMTMRELITKLSKPIANPKLLLDGMKEWGRHFPSERAVDSSANEMPVTVHLVHNMARPDRGTPAQDLQEVKHEAAGD